MAIYYVTILVISALLISTKKYRKLNVTALFISFIILWLIASLRGLTVGADTVPYYQFFSLLQEEGIKTLNGVSIVNLFSVNGFENGFTFYTYLIGSLFSSFTTYFLISYGFIYYSFYRFIKKYSSDYLFSMIIFISLFFFGTMNTFRQSLAMGVLAWGFGYILERKLIKYIALVLLATLIHQSSLLMLVPYFLYGKKVSKHNITVSALATIPLLLLINNIIYGLAGSNARYYFYVDRLNSFSIGSVITFLIILMITVLLFTIYRLNNITYFEKDNILKSFYIKILLLSTVFSAVAIKVNSISRISNLYLMYSVTGIPDFFKHTPRTPYIRSLRLIIMFALLIISFAQLYLKPEWLGVSEYTLTSMSIKW
jgi:hypothetical protein